jgi:uncharacterized membrane protein
MPQSSPAHRHRNPAESPGVGRVEAFSDGVIAIIITIMVLELRVPEHAIEQGHWLGLIEPMLPRLFAYTLSFVLIGLMWINHHRLLNLVDRVPRALAWVNLHLLFWMSLIPVSTAILGSHPFVPLAVAAYGVVQCANNIAFLLLHWYVSTLAPAREVATARLHSTMIIRNFMGVGIYAASIPVAYFSVYASFALLLLAPTLFLVTNWRRPVA